MREPARRDIIIFAFKTRIITAKIIRFLYYAAKAPPQGKLKISLKTKKVIFF